MGLRYPDQKNHSCFFITTSYINHSAFGHIPGFNEEIINSLIYYSDKYRGKISGYVLMPSHIHLLLFIDGNKLAGFMRDFKKYIAQKVGKRFDIRTPNIWQRGYDRVAIGSERIFRIKLTYIHNNPVKAKLAKSPETYIWSSAKDYYTKKKSVLDVWKEWK